MAETNYQTENYIQTVKIIVHNLVIAKEVSNPPNRDHEALNVEIQTFLKKGKMYF